jgi:hypothetical protein
MAELSVKQWLAQWRQAGPLLDRIRQEKLRRMNSEERQQAIAAVLDLGSCSGKRRTTSGLVELQRLLAKGRK